MSDWKETLPVAFFIHNEYRSQSVRYLVSSKYRL